MECALWKDKNVVHIDKNKAPISYEGRKVAAHAFLYSKSSAILFGHIEMKHAILMQLRFDGKLGFPGGLVEKGEEIIIGLNRELTEEIGLERKFYLKEDNYFQSWVSSKLVDHFYIKEFSESDFKSIEASILKANDWGGETLGIIRVPVHMLHDNPSRNFNKALIPFLRHCFISNAREELIEGIIANKILSRDEMESIWRKAIQ